jgi:hypothetical protein
MLIDFRYALHLLLKTPGFPLAAVDKNPSISFFQTMNSSEMAFGLVAGLIAAFVNAGLIQSLLFSVEPFDPVICEDVALLFAVIAALACVLPSLRASCVDPLVALRTE